MFIKHKKNIFTYMAKATVAKRERSKLDKPIAMKTSF